jgi:hypothetical protein
MPIKKNDLMNDRRPTVNKLSFLLPVLPVIFFFSHCITQFNELIFTTGVLLLFFVYSLVALLLFVLLNKLFKFSRPLALFCSTLLMTEFLFFGQLHDALIRLKKNIYLDKSFVLLFVLLAALIIIVFLLRKKREAIERANRFLMIVFVTLIIYEAVVFTMQLVSGKNINAIARKMTKPIDVKANRTPAEKPDIYYILFDSYTNSPSLKKYWEYDNDIVPFLRSKNFFLVDSAHSNYISTPFSVSSTLNMQYLKGAEPYLLSNSSNFLVGRRVYLDNILYNFLKEQGYTFSIFSQLEDNELVTKFGILGVEKPARWLRKLTMERITLNPWNMDKLKKILFKKSTPFPEEIMESMRDFHDYNGKAIDFILKDCRVTKPDNPVFNFTHIMLPHDPYQVDEEGKPIQAAQPGGQDMKGYLAQVKYSNTLIRKITDCLLADSSRKKIIIFQGDHGYRHYTNAPVGEQFSALQAIYFPDGDYSMLPSRFSHVNTYRIILNKLYDTRLPLLTDSIFVEKRD